MNSQSGIQPEPGLVRDTHEPKGVLRKNLKPLIYLGAALLVIVAAVFSGSSRKTPSQQAAARHEPPQPTVQDNTDNNVQDLKNHLAAEQQKEAQQAGLANATAAQQTAAAAYSPTGQAVPCVPGQPCAQPNVYGQQPGSQPQVTPAQEEAQQLAAKERELAYNSRFASNIVYSHQPDMAMLQQAPAGTEGAGVAGYAVTSHSSQGLTAERVLVNADTNVHPDLLNSRFGYVSISRASHDATLFTNDMAKLNPQLSAEVSKSAALDIGQVPSVGQVIGF